MCKGKYEVFVSLSPGKFHGQRSLVGYSLWGHKESEAPEHAHKDLFSCSIKPPRPTHVVANDKLSSFLWLSNIQLYIYTTSSSSIHPLMGT